MAQAPKLDMNEIVAEFGVTRGEVDAEIKRRLSEPGRSYTAEEVRDHFKQLSSRRRASQTKKSRANDR
jgi:hypothetical protein